MGDQYTYEVRDQFCPEHCGHGITPRSKAQTPYAMCPRCNGARFADFRPHMCKQQPAPLVVEHPTEVK